MSMAVSYEGPVGATVVEVLSVVLAPGLRARVLREALALEGTDAVPEDLLRAQAFVEGPLRLVVKRRVGAGVAGLLLESLAPIFARVRDSSYRDRSAHELTVVGEEEEDEVEANDTGVYNPSYLEELRDRIRSTSAPIPLEPQTQERLALPRTGHGPAGPNAERSRSGIEFVAERTPRILLASGAHGARYSLKPRLHDDVDVLVLPDAYDVVQALATMSPPWWLVVDCCREPISLEVLGWFEMSEPLRCRVLVWGYPPAEFDYLLERVGWSELHVDDDWASLAAALRAELAQNGRRG